MDHYERVRQIALLDTAAFIAATVGLLLLNIPMVEADKVPGSWYTILYYGVIGGTAVLGGLIVLVVLMLYNTVRYMVLVVGPADTRDLDLVETPDENEGT